MAPLDSDWMVAELQYTFALADNEIDIVMDWLLIVGDGDACSADVAVLNEDCENDGGPYFAGAGTEVVLIGFVVVCVIDVAFAGNIGFSVVPYTILGQPALQSALGFGDVHGPSDKRLRSQPLHVNAINIDVAMAPRQFPKSDSANSHSI